jgi:hypothetical protein
VESGPLVRSSYHAKEQAREVDPVGPGALTEILEADEGSRSDDRPGEAEARASLTPLRSPRWCSSAPSEGRRITDREI